MEVAVIYLVVLVAGFFFLVVRPQRRQMAARRALIASVQVGDEVMTTGGIYGTIRSLGDDSVELEIAPAVVVTVARGAIAGLVNGSDRSGNELRSADFGDDHPDHDLSDDESHDESHDERPDAAGGAG
jgi:preprotein translocase subunit YajC